MVARLKTRSRGESGGLTIGVHASLSAGNLRATLIEHRRAFPDVEIHLVDGSSEHLISDVASSAIDVAFVADNHPERDAKWLSVWSERVVVALPEDHPLASRDVVHWSDLRHEALLVPQRGPGPEFLKLLASKRDILIPVAFFGTMSDWIGFSRWSARVGAFCLHWRARLERLIRASLIGKCMTRMGQLAWPSEPTGAKPTAILRWRPFLIFSESAIQISRVLSLRAEQKSRRALANARSVAMNRSIMGAISLAGSGADWPVARPRISA